MSYIDIIIGAVIGFYVLTTHARIYYLEQQIKKIPTTEQIVKEVLHTKIPLTQIPENLKNDILNYLSQEQQTKQSINNKRDKGSYIG